MRDLLLDVPFVGSDQIREGDVPIVDAQRQAFPEQRFREDDEWALTEIVGAVLEAESEETDLFPARLHDLVECVLDLEPVARQDVGDDGQIDVQLPGAVLEGPNVLRKARSAERESGLEI